MPSSNWISIIESHVAKGKGGDFKLFDKVDKYFLGKPWTDTTVGESEAELIKTSQNFVLPVVETAASTLIPPHPQITLIPRNALERGQIDASEGIVNYTFDECHFRDELAITVQNVVKYGRGPVKTTWDADRDIPVTKFLDPRNYFFDQTAQRFDDVRYEIEATILSRADMKKRIEAGMYPPTATDKQSAERYPTWLLPDGKSEINKLKDYQPWYLVWEVYDREAGKVYHYLPEDNEPILEDDLTFRPYDLLTFTYNGTNIGGVSEIGLILPNIENYNWTATFLLNILRFTVPGTYYDAAAISGDEVVKLQMAPLGAMSGIPLKSGKSLMDLFRDRPTPAYPAIANDILNTLRESISFTSAISDAHRAQTIGAKTATELAFIEGNTKNRLRPRQMRVDSLIERVAEKHLYLSSLYMRNDKVLKLTGSNDWKPVSPTSLEGVSATFKIVPYSAMESNKAVQIETLRNIQPLLVGNPHVDQRKLTEKLFSMLELGNDMLVPMEQVQAAMAAQQPPGAPGAPMAPPEPQDGSELPPRAAHFSDAVAAPPGTSMPQEQTP